MTQNRLKADGAKYGRTALQGNNETAEMQRKQCQRQSWARKIGGNIRSRVQWGCRRGMQRGSMQQWAEGRRQGSCGGNNGHLQACSGEGTVGGTQSGKKRAVQNNSSRRGKKKTLALSPEWWRSSMATHLSTKVKEIRGLFIIWRADDGGFLFPLCIDFHIALRFLDDFHEIVHWKFCNWPWQKLDKGQYVPKLSHCQCEAKTTNIFT